MDSHGKRSLIEASLWKYVFRLPAPCSLPSDLFQGALLSCDKSLKNALKPIFLSSNFVLKLD